MLTIIASVLTLASAASAALSYFYAHQTVAAQKQTKIIAGQIAERIDAHTQEIAQWVQQARSHQEQTRIIADKAAERIDAHAQKMDEHTQRIDDHTQRVTEWIQQVQLPQKPIGDPYAKGRAEIVERAKDPDVIAQVAEAIKRRDQNNTLIPPAPEAQSNQAEWQARQKFPQAR
jgi:hypothetical protein